jgi:hypothetical protein
LRKKDLFQRLDARHIDRVVRVAAASAQGVVVDALAIDFA